MQIRQDEDKWSLHSGLYYSLLKRKQIDDLW